MLAAAEIAEEKNNLVVDNDWYVSHFEASLLCLELRNLEYYGWVFKFDENNDWKQDWSINLAVN